MRQKTALLLLVFIGLIVYASVIFNGFIGDDNRQIIQNQDIQSLKSIPNLFTGSTFYSGGKDYLSGAYYKPVLLIFYSLIYAIHGPDPLFFHLVQLIIHICNVLMLYLLLKYFFSKKIAFFGSLLFLVHPINQETVAYIADMQDVLFTFFGLLSLLFVIHGKIRNRLKDILILFLLFLLTLLSKETGILFLSICAVYCYFFDRKNIFLILQSATYALFVYVLLRVVVAKLSLSAGSIAPISTAGINIRILNIPEIFSYYIKTFFLPINILSMQFWLVRTIDFSHVIAPLLFSLLFLFILYKVLLYFSRGQKKKYLLYLFFVIWFLSGMLFHLQIVPLDMTVANRWFYFPCIGLIGIGCLCLSSITIKKRLAKRLIFLFFIIWLLIGAGRTVIRNFDWKDSKTLYTKDLKYDPNNFYIENGLGSELIVDEEYEMAKPHILHSIALYPYYANLNNMAIIFIAENNIPMAKNYMEQSLQSSSNYLVYENYAYFLLKYDSLHTTQEFTMKSLQMFPKNPKLLIILAQIFYKQKNMKQATQYAKEAYSLSENEYITDTYKSIESYTL